MDVENEDTMEVSSVLLARLIKWTLVLKTRYLEPPCDFDPVPYKGQPIGMFHCPYCGEMVLAGLPHPNEFFTLDDDLDRALSLVKGNEKLELEMM